MVYAAVFHSGNRTTAITEGVVSALPQRGPCRFEFRGGVEDYCEVAKRWLAPQGRFVVCEGWNPDQRTLDAIEAAALSTGNLKTFATGAQWPAFGQLIGRLNRIRGYGDFLHYHLLASGRIDAVVESDVNILDVGACAGGGTGRSCAAARANLCRP